MSYSSSSLSSSSTTASVADTDATGFLVPSQGVVALVNTNHEEASEQLLSSSLALLERMLTRLLLGNADTQFQSNPANTLPSSHSKDSDVRTWITPEDVLNLKACWMESMLKLSLRSLFASWDLYSNASGVSITISENLKETYDKITKLLREATETLTSSHSGNCIIDSDFQCFADPNSDSDSDSNNNNNNNNNNINSKSADKTAESTSSSTFPSLRIQDQAYATSFEAYVLSKKLQTDPSLLPQLYFPIEQRLAMYAPYWIPLFIPLLRAIFKKKDKNIK